MRLHKTMDAACGYAGASAGMTTSFWSARLASQDACLRYFLGSKLPHSI
jgi:hypothetical protein